MTGTLQASSLAWTSSGGAQGCSCEFGPAGRQLASPVGWMRNPPGPKNSCTVAAVAIALWQMSSQQCLHGFGHGVWGIEGRPLQCLSDPMSVPLTGSERFLDAWHALISADSHAAGMLAWSGCGVTPPRTPIRFLPCFDVACSPAACQHLATLLCVILSFCFFSAVSIIHSCRLQQSRCACLIWTMACQCKCATQPWA